MVKNLTNVTSLTGNGLRDWLIQRVTSLVMLVYIVFLLSFFLFHLLHLPLDYETWKNLFNHIAMRLFSSLFLLSLVWHAWIGIWTIVTDYIKPLALRLSLQILFIVMLLLYLIVGLAIFWAN